MSQIDLIENHSNSIGPSTKKTSLKQQQQQKTQHKCRNERDT